MTFDFENPNVQITRTFDCACKLWKQENRKINFIQFENPFLFLIHIVIYWNLANDGHAFIRIAKTYIGLDHCNVHSWQYLLGIQKKETKRIFQCVCVSSKKRQLQQRSWRKASFTITSYLPVVPVERGCGWGRKDCVELLDKEWN